MKTVSITLEGLDFFAYHGVLDAEQKIGNRYTVSLNIEAQVSDKAYQADQLEGTIDYGEIYQLVKQVMQNPNKLLEHLAHKINEACLNKFAEIQEINTSISKHNPPVGGLCQAAKISIREVRQ